MTEEDEAIRGLGWKSPAYNTLIILAIPGVWACLGTNISIHPVDILNSLYVINVVGLYIYIFIVKYL